MADLQVRIENPLPASLPVGVGTGLFCYGTCFHRQQAVQDLALLVDGDRHRPAAIGMPRRDLFDSLQEAPAYRSGFWATLPIAPRERPGAIELAAAVRLESGAELVAPLGRIDVAEHDRPPALPNGAAGPGLIAICLATFEPDTRLFQAQIDSLRAQTDDRWICLLSDDCSGPERFEEIRQIVGADERFVVSRSERRLGFYRNFERALRMVPDEAELVALCDHDDSWHPEKLEVLRGAIGQARLVYSDQRLVDADGRVLRDTMWKGRRNNHTNLASLLIANTLTGAAMLFRRDVAELALPFPDSPGLQFHDHWLGLVALAMGDVAYVDRPLYDYVQHSGAVFGEVTTPGTDSSAAADRATRRRPVLRGRFSSWRAAYFCGYLAREVQAQTLLVRCASALSGPKRRALRRFVASPRSPLAFAWLVARPLRRLAGLDETLGSETELVGGILWRWLIPLRVRRSREPRAGAPDASFPHALDFEQRRLRRWRGRL